MAAEGIEIRLKSGELDITKHSDILFHRIRNIQGFKIVHTDEM